MKTLAIALLIPFAVTLAPILLFVAAVVGVAYAGRKWLPALSVALLWSALLFVSGFALYFAIVGALFAADYAAGMVGNLISYSGALDTLRSVDGESIFVTLMFASAIMLPMLPKAKAVKFPALENCGQESLSLPDLSKIYPTDNAADDIAADDTTADVLPHYVTGKFNVLCPDGIVRICKLNNDRKTGKVKAFHKTVTGKLSFDADGNITWQPTGKNAAIFA